MQTLAEFLGTAPLIPEKDKPRLVEPRLVDIRDSKAFAEAVLDSYEFRQYIVNGLLLGTLPAAILIRVMDLAGWQKPPDRLEVHTVDRAEDMTSDQIEARATRLFEMARLLRRAEQFDEPLTQDSVH